MLTLKKFRVLGVVKGQYPGFHCGGDSDLAICNHLESRQFPLGFFQRVLCLGRQFNCLLYVLRASLEYVLGPTECVDKGARVGRP